MYAARRANWSRVRKTDLRESRYAPVRKSCVAETTISPLRGVTRRDKHAEQRERLGARLLRLRQVEVHLVAVEVGVVRRAHALVEAERAPLHHARAVRHDRELVQRRLPVEEHDVAVGQVALDDVAHLELGRDAAPVAVLERLLALVGRLDVVRARPDIGAVEDELAQLVGDSCAGRRRASG